MSLCFVVEPVDANGTWGGRKRHGEKGTAGQSVRWRRSVREWERGRDQGSFSRLVVAGDSNENKSAVRRTGSCVRVKRSCGPVKQRQRVRSDIIYRSGSERERKCSRDKPRVLPSLDRGKKGPIGQQSAVTAEIQRSREMSLTCRVQYLNDVDPFAYASSYPEPPRPPVHTFSATLPLINQLAAVHRLLRAPHRVSWSFSFKKATAFLLIHSFIEGSRAN